MESRTPLGHAASRALPAKLPRPPTVDGDQDAHIRRAAAAPQPTAKYLYWMNFISNFHPSGLAVTFLCARSALNVKVIRPA